MQQRTQDRASSPAESTTAPEIFRFLDLPTEVRRMVYKRLPRQIKHHHVVDPSKSNDRLLLITRCLPVAILRTCKVISAEAADIVEKIWDEFILSEGPRFMATYDLMATHTYESTRRGYMGVCHVNTWNEFTRALHELLDDYWDDEANRDRVIMILREMIRDCLQEVGIEASLGKFHAQSCRQMRYEYTTPLGESRSVPIRFMMVDDEEFPMTGQEKEANSITICEQIAHEYDPLGGADVHCDGFLPAHSYTSLGVSRDVVRTLIDVRHCVVEGGTSITESALDVETWRDIWLE